MPEDISQGEKKWHKTWHKTYLKGEIKAYLKNGIPSRKEIVNTIDVYIHSNYVNRIDVESMIINIAASQSFKWDEDSRLRFKLLKMALRDRL